MTNLYNKLKTKTWFWFVKVFVQVWIGFVLAGLYCVARHYIAELQK